MGAIDRFLSWVLGLADPGPSPPPTPVPTAPPATDLGRPLLAEINRARSVNHMPPLAWDEVLADISLQNCGYCEDGGSLGHYYDGHNAQCVEWNTPDAASTVASWLADKDHRPIVLGPYGKCGCARSGPYWTATFAGVEPFHPHVELLPDRP